MSATHFGAVMSFYHGPVGRKMIFLSLANSASSNGICWPSMRTVATESECSVRRAREHVSALVAEGWLIRTERAGHSNIYQIDAPTDHYYPQNDKNGDGETGEGRRAVAGEVGEPSPGGEYPYPGEPSPGGRRAVAGEVGEPSPGGRRGTAPRTVKEPLMNQHGTVARDHLNFLNQVQPEPEMEMGMGDAVMAPTPPTPSPRAPMIALWRRVCDRLTARGYLTRQQLQNWIAPLSLMAVSDDTVYLAAPTSDAARIVRERFADLLTPLFALELDNPRLTLDVRKG